MNKEYIDKEKIIINNYGIDNQLKYMQSEVFELNEAVIVYETEIRKMHSWNRKVLKNHTAEEIADVMVMLKQIQLYYGIPDEQIEEMMKYKIDRIKGSDK